MMSNVSSVDMYNKRDENVYENEMVAKPVDNDEDMMIRVVSDTPEPDNRKTASSYKRAVMRWQKLYTIVCNPSIARTSKSFYKVTVLGEEDFGDNKTNIWKIQADRDKM